MKMIIIPTDFSPAATNAMHFGLSMAKEIGASVLLYHVYQIPVSMADVPVVLVSSEDLKENAEAQLAQLKKEAEGFVSGEVRINTEAEPGNTVDELEDLCARLRPFAVVMGRHGSSGMERILFGSTALITIKHLTAPVLIVPPDTTYGGIKKVGFACDFKKVVETTPTPYIIDFIRSFKAELHVLNVNYVKKQPDAKTKEESLLLEQMLADLKPQFHFIHHENVEDGINQFAEANHLDLLIAIPKKHNMLEGLFRKDKAKQLVVESHVPILCIHEH